VTRINMKPTHMIGGYAQLAYGFNYYGTVGANRDEIIILRKMSQVNWFDKAADEWVENVQATEEQSHDLKQVVGAQA
jgi:nitrate reductase alpha subunit